MSLSKDAPLIKDGIVPPVKNPTQSFVNELQLKSSSKNNFIVKEQIEMKSYLEGDTVEHY